MRGVGLLLRFPRKAIDKAHGGQEGRPVTLLRLREPLDQDEDCFSANLGFSSRRCRAAMDTRRRSRAPRTSGFKASTRSACSMNRKAFCNAFLFSADCIRYSNGATSLGKAAHQRYATSSQAPGRTPSYDGTTAGSFPRMGRLGKARSRTSSGFRKYTSMLPQLGMSARISAGWPR